jgi:carboxyl-terminal processing protease
MKTRFCRIPLPGVILFLIFACSTASFAVDSATASQEARRLNSLQLEAKFLEAYSKIQERYIDRIQSVTLMIYGFREMLAVPGLESLKYTDLVGPTQRLGGRKEDLAAFRNALQVIRARAGTQADLDKLVSAMIRGMVRALHDDYSTYLEPEKNRELVKYLRGEAKSFGGIGVQIQFKEGQCKVIRPIPDTPAYRAGIRPGDVVLEIDGVQVTSEDEAVDRMKGDPGTPVAVTVQRSEVTDALTFQLLRQTITQPELEKILLPGEVGYIRLNSFNENSPKELLENVRYLEGQGMKKCILDLRRNSGGLLKAAVDISEIFLPKGSLVVSTKGRQVADSKEYRTRDAHSHTRLPLIVLVDEYTASAAEIVTGAVRDNRRGKVIGATTFGKGTVQEIIPLDDDSALKLTVAKYYTPVGECIHKTGIKPDYSVAVDANHVLNPALFEESAALDLNLVSQDTQIKRALDLFGVSLPTPGT